MSRATHRQIARLEQRMKPVIARVQQLKRNERLDLVAAAGHAATLAFIIRYGTPQIGEPLSRAFERVEDSEAWKECCRSFPTALGWARYKFRAVSLGASEMAIRHEVIRSFKGKDERDKLSRVFESAPPWFIWFTFADHTARKLGLRLPNLSEVTCFQRSCPHEKNAYRGDRYRIPEGAFKQHPWPEGVVHDAPARAMVFDLTWPILLPKDMVENGVAKVLGFKPSDPNRGFL